MPARRTGRLVHKTYLSPILATFRVIPEPSHRFPRYTAGQYVALGRDDVPLTRQVGVDPSGAPLYGPDVDDSGHRRVGTVMHAYSVASAPWETEAHGFLEFYVVQELTSGVPGRLSTHLLGLSAHDNQPVNYIDRIVGHFTLDALARDARRVVMVGTGTGLAPFVSMIKQLHHDGGDGRIYTLLHTNRTFEELGYHQTLLEVESAKRFDFLYLATVSRPTERNRRDARVGTGRATNVLRLLYELPMTEEERVSTAAPGQERAVAEQACQRAIRPTLPAAVTLQAIRDRLGPEETVILTCGNVASTSDIQLTARRLGIRAEVELW